MVMPPGPNPSGATTQPPDAVVRAAFVQAAQRFKKGLSNDKLYDQIVQTDSIDKVYDATDKLQKDQSKSRRLQNLGRIGPYLEGLRSYASVIDTFVQAKPDILALIWGPIKLLLQWTSNMTESFEALIATIAEVGALLPEFKEMATLFYQNEQIKDVLILVFSDILNFHLVALNFFGMKRTLLHALIRNHLNADLSTGIKFFFKSLWPGEKEKIKLVQSHILQHKSVMRNEVRLQSLRDEHEARQRALDHYEQTQKSATLQEFNSIRNDVAAKLYDDRLAHFHTRTCEGTGTWLFQDSTFIKWMKAADPAVKILWLQGIPGAGTRPQVISPRSWVR